MADPDRAKFIFLTAAERPAGAERAAYLADACGGNPDLRREVDELLAHLERVGSFLEAPSRGPAEAPSPAEAAGTRIGAYKLVEVIAEGGMGTVWLAQQTEPVTRLVALKVIKAGMGSKAVVARFEAERQALALMEHPNIAKVLDGGTTADGRPYFAMELVKGVPITKYCDDHKLPPRERLELFIQVCQAVQHAHQKGVIHRDLKPGNVLVAPYDGRPVPKVIDFGVAKAVGQPLTERTLVTGLGAVVGTLEYMSPEQAELNNLDVDTRSDIYSLGVLLYELLTGTTPLQRDRLKQAALFEMLRVIREDDPPRPSTRLSTTAELPDIAANRGLDPRKLSGVVRGELDWIVMKCLEKDRNRRYDTATGLARDLERYLKDEPVGACPPSAGYRLRKLTRRHRRALVTAALCGFVLLLGIAGVAGTVGWAMRDRAALREEVARERAEQHRAVEQEAARALAEAEAAFRAGEVARAKAAVRRAEALLAGIDGADELRQAGRQWQADLAMVEALAGIRLAWTATKDGGAARAAADAGYAQAFRDYGIDVEALDPADAVGRLRDGRLRLDLAAALNGWAGARRRAGTPEARWQPLVALAQAIDPDPARTCIRAALARQDRDALVELAASDELAKVPARTVASLGDTLRALGAVDEATAVLRAAQRRHPDDFWINYSLAYSLAQRQPPQREEAVRFYTAAVALWREAPYAHINLGVTLAELNRPDDAADAFREALRLDPELAEAHNSLGVVLAQKKQLEEAVRSFREAVRHKPGLVEAHANLGRALQELGRFGEAAPVYREAVRLRPEYAPYRYELGRVLWRLEAEEDAITEYRQAVRLRPVHAETHFNLGLALRTTGRDREAIAEFEQAAAQKPEMFAAKLHLASLLANAADPALRDVVRARDLAGRVAAEHPKNAWAWDTLGLCQYRSGDFAAAVQAALSAANLRCDSGRTRFVLAMARWRLGNQDEARRLYDRGVELLSEASKVSREEAMRLRAEAAGLLGIEGEK